MKHDALRSEIKMLLENIDEAFEKKAWHGPNLRGSLRGVTPQQAAWRPAPGRHNIWEIVVHAAYWKYAVRRRLLGEKRGSFPLKGSNWFDRSTSLTAASQIEEAWWKDLALLAEEHAKLRAAIAALSPAALRKRSRNGRTSPLILIRGIALHDVYHAGQIQLLKRLQK